MNIEPKNSFRIIMTDAEFSALQDVKRNVAKILDATKGSILIDGEEWTEHDITLVIEFMENLTDEAELI